MNEQLKQDDGLARGGFQRTVIQAVQTPVPVEEPVPVVEEDESEDE